MQNMRKKWLWDLHKVKQPQTLLEIGFLINIATLNLALSIKIGK